MAEGGGGKDGRDEDGGAGGRAALAAAILRVGESLDLETVLREIVEGARRLTGARLGIVATVDESGFPGEHVFSGFTPDGERELAEWADGLGMVEHLNGLPGPLRVADLPAYTRSVGLTPLPTFPGTFQGTPVRHRGVGVGYLFLGEKAGGAAFTAEDEETLLLFAAQAAAAIGNARAHRGELRARKNLEALVETSPVGVVVFDGGGRMASLNREARRIVESLREPDGSVEELLDVVVCRRADGREASLAEFPLAERFADPETVRSEEVVLSVPDGRSVRTLINATPVPAEGSGSGSVVVTMQDLAPLEETERLRAEFLRLVSHELRAPLTSVTGSAVVLVDESETLDRAEMREFHRIILEQAGHMRGLIADLLDAGRIDSGTLSVSPEPTSVADLVERARGAFLAGGPGRSVVVDLAEGLPPVMADRRRVVQVLNNLLANAARHTAVSGSIRVAAARDGQNVAVSVADDGDGVPAELLPRLFLRHEGGGSGTAAHGLGLAICKGLVEAHGGRIQATSDGPGRGTIVTFTLPAAEPGETETGRAGAAGSGSPAKGARVLVVDDDPNTLRLVRGALASAGHAPIVTGTADDLADLIRSKRPELVLLDLRLPGHDGLVLLEEVPELSDLPVIFISGYGRDETVARAFELGAEDYIVKPFSPTELVARVGAALGRRREPEPFVLGDLEIRHESREVTVRGKAVDLTPKEYDVLRVLSENAGRLVRHETLLRRVWAGRSAGDPNLVRTFVLSLRRKLGDDASDPTWIFTRRGVGYSMPRPDGS